MHAIREFDAARDIEPVSQLLFNAYNTKQDASDVLVDIPSPEFAASLLRNLVKHEQGSIGKVAVDINGIPIGVVLTDRRSHPHVLAIGPFAVDPLHQHVRVASTLLESIVENARAAGVRSLRSVVPTNCAAPIAMFTGHRFTARDSITLLSGIPSVRFTAGHVTIRPISDEDLDDCVRLHEEIVGFNRARVLRECLDDDNIALFGQPQVAFRFESKGDVVGFSTGAHMWGMTVAVDDDVACALFSEMVGTEHRSGLPALHVMGRLYPHLLSRLVHEWNMKVVRQSTLMSLGDYEDPSNGVYLPCVWC